MAAAYSIDRQEYVSHGVESLAQRRRPQIGTDPPNMSIDAIHGVVAYPSNKKFVDRNLLDTEGFTDYLRKRTRPYCPLASAISGGGDALTLDDSTVAAAEAARLACCLGHAVTLFVNGYNIVMKKPYLLSRLNVLLDNTNLQTVRFEGQVWNISDLGGKQGFRRLVKSRLVRMRTEHARDQFVTAIGRLLYQEDICVPSYLQVITETELRELKSVGVDIQNHGWTHAPAASLTSETHSENIRRGREWLRHACSVEAEYYAVPNGNGLPPCEHSPHYSAWFLLDDRWPPGEIFPGVFSRTNLILPTTSTQ